MKKFFLVFAAIGFMSFMSCKDSAKKSVDEIEKTTEEAIISATGAGMEAATTIDEIQNVSIEIPEFSNPDVQQYAKEYAEFFQKIRAAAQTGDQQEILNLQNMAPEWTKGIQKYTQQMTPEDVEKWDEWTKKIAELSSVTE